MRSMIYVIITLLLIISFVAGSGCSVSIKNQSIAIEEQSSSLESPFGFHPAGVFVPGYADAGFDDAQYIGVQWHRPPVYAFWFVIQTDLDDPDYNWTLLDQQYGSVPSGINILANITPDNARSPHGYMAAGSYRPVDRGKYIAFVKATVERYDGDGVQDMQGLKNPIKHWQVDNEPKAEIAGFADLQRITYLAVKDACPECTVVIGGAAGFPANYTKQFDACYLPILNQLAGRYVDVFDFHWYGTAEGDYRMRDSATGEDVYDHVRATLSAKGYSMDIPIWITEMGSYSGDPAEGRFPVQTERQQAGDYFKRFIYPLSRGVEKVFPAFGLIEGFKLDDSYFDHTGLIYDGRLSKDPGMGVKKLGYYTYKKMTEKLRGADWSTLTTIHNGYGMDNLYLFRVTKDGLPIHIAWWDYFDESDYVFGESKEITLTGLAGSIVSVTNLVPDSKAGCDVTDFATAFTVTSYSVSDGQVTLAIGQDPVIIE